MENRSVTDEERIFQLQRELEAAVLLGEETDRKFEEVRSHDQIVIGLVLVVVVVVVAVVVR